jgi:hypothetical protein
MLSMTSAISCGMLPFTIEDIIKLNGQTDKGLYQIYTYHPIYVDCFVCMVSPMSNISLAWIPAHNYEAGETQAESIVAQTNPLEKLVDLTDVILFSFFIIVFVGFCFGIAKAMLSRSANISAAQVKRRAAETAIAEVRQAMRNAMVSPAPDRLNLVLELRSLYREELGGSFDDLIVDEWTKARSANLELHFGPRKNEGIAERSAFQSP